MSKVWLPPAPFYLYAENWPANEQVPTTGLDRALVPIVTSLESWRPTVLLAPRALKHVRHSLHARVEPLAVRPGISSILWDELRSYKQDGYNGSGLRLSSLGKCIPQGGGFLLSILGGDGRAYLRAASLAKTAGLQHLVYTVDDPFSWADSHIADLPKLQDLKPAIGAALSEARAVMAITQGLSDALSKKVRRICKVLPLPYIEPPVARDTILRQLIYVGNMSHLYGDSFIQVVDAISRRRINGDDIRLRATFTSDALKPLLPNIPDFIDLGRINERKAFLEAIGNSLAAICPIAFDPSEEMVRSSFPSKLLEYLGQARNIIVHAPVDSVASRYFTDAGLPHVTSTQTELDAALALIATSTPDHSRVYREQLDRVHGGVLFRSTLSAAMIEQKGI